MFIILIKTTDWGDVVKDLRNANSRSQVIGFAETERQLLDISTLTNERLGTFPALVVHPDALELLFKTLSEMSFPIDGVFVHAGRGAPTKLDGLNTLRNHNISDPVWHDKTVAFTLGGDSAFRIAESAEWFRGKGVSNLSEELSRAHRKLRAWSESGCLLEQSLRIQALMSKDISESLVSKFKSDLTQWLDSEDARLMLVELNVDGEALKNAVKNPSVAASHKQFKGLLSAARVFLKKFSRHD